MAAPPRTLILMYHQVDEPLSTREARYCCLPAAFARQMEHLARNYHPLTLERLLGTWASGEEVPERSVVVTFDDGFAGVWHHALPVLKRLDIPATLFMLSDRIGGHNDWMTAEDYPARELLTLEQLQDLRASGLFSIGSHTRSHPRLPELPDARLKDEIRISKARLEDCLGVPVEHFAYPYGREDQRVRDAVEAAGYRSACSTRSGFNRPGQDPFLLRRIDISGHDRLGHFKRKLRFGANEVGPGYLARYYLGRIVARLQGH